MNFTHLLREFKGKRAQQVKKVDPSNGISYETLLGSKSENTWNGHFPNFSQLRFIFRIKQTEPPSILSWLIFFAFLSIFKVCQM